MAAQDAREAKVDDAVAAAQDPATTVTADDAQREMVEQSRNAGVPAFTFDPDATPEQKRAQARAVCLPPFTPPATFTGLRHAEQLLNLSSPLTGHSSGAPPESPRKIRCRCN